MRDYAEQKDHNLIRKGYCRMCKTETIHFCGTKYWYCTRIVQEPTDANMHTSKICGSNNYPADAIPYSVER